MEGQQLQRDDTQDPLQAVHTVRHFDVTTGVFDGFVIVLVTDHDGAALESKQSTSSVSGTLVTDTVGESENFLCSRK